MTSRDFFKNSWLGFGYDARLARWVEHALPYARAAVVARGNRHWWRSGDTWFVGANVLNNAPDGSLGEGPPLAGDAVDFIYQQLQCEPVGWDRAQLSVCYPGYPRPMEGESAAAFGFRRERDAAHIDGLLAEGVQRQRHLREHHQFILGIPMVDYVRGASPFVVWEGSHEIVRAGFEQRFAGIASENWDEEDVTAAYHQLRRQVFKVCRRVELTARPGEAYLVHRLALHGITPWKSGAPASTDGRMICYFRPVSANPGDWLLKP